MKLTEATPIIAITIYADGDVLMMHTMEKPQSREAGIICAMDMVNDAVQAHPEACVTANVAVSTMRYALAFDGSIWRYL